ncbi:cyclin-dependent kinase inhibitor 2c [Anaeramoeba flamelloides]|uniref:Cyclin-dependent kinase inhibitor 2c n=1 Tax=Anaeramoeba flamelloides TaxID=1746091 RepID=A0AAV7ZQB4_9EUKA|nr:cyclin-dependent kinase inhibitor 2c [Anaeramoeba flamelloides]
MKNAILNKNYKKVEHILTTNPKTKDDLIDGINKLQIAIDNKDLAMLKLLVEFDVSPLVVGWSGENVFEYTIKKKKPRKYIETILNVSKNYFTFIFQEPMISQKLGVFLKSKKWKVSIKLNFQFLRKCLDSNVVKFARFKKIWTSIISLSKEASINEKQKYQDLQDRIFYYSVLQNNEKIATYILSNGAGVNYWEPKTETNSLFWAIYYHFSIDFIESLFANKINYSVLEKVPDLHPVTGKLINLKYIEQPFFANQVCVLNIAVMFRVSIDIFKLLVNYTDQYRFVDSNDMSLLDWCLCKKNRSQYSKVILNHMLEDKNRIKNQKQLIPISNKPYNNSLVLSIKNSTVEITKILLDNAVDCNSRDHDGIDAIIWSLYYHQPAEIIQWYIKKGYDVKKTFPAFSFKVYDHQNKKIKKSISYPYLKKKNRKLTLMHYAVIFESPIDTFDALLNAGCDFLSQDKVGNTALHLSLSTKEKTKYFDHFCLSYNENLPKRLSLNKMLFNLLIFNFPTSTIRCLMEKDVKLTNISKYKSITELFMLKSIDDGTYRYLSKRKNLEIPFYIKGDLHYLLQCEKIEHLETLLLKGAEVNEVYQEETPLYIACSKGDEKPIALLLRFGADIEQIVPRTGRTAISIIYRTELIERFTIYQDFVKSYEKIYLKRSNCEIQIKSTDNHDILLHKTIFDARLGEFIDLKQFLKIISNYTLVQIEVIIKWMYTGNFDQVHKEFIHFFCSAINIPEKIFKEKCFKKGLKADFENIFLDEKTADFHLIIKNNEEEISLPIHKLILIARSQLFKEMLVNIDSECKSVHDYTGRSLQAIKCFLRFLYTDQIDETISEETLDELYFAEDFYRLSEYNSLFPRLSIIRRKRRRERKEKKMK